jgi:dihydroorotase
MICQNKVHLLSGSPTPQSMKLLIYRTLIADPRSAFHKKTCDVLIHSGNIVYIKPHNKKNKADATKVIDANGAWLMPGLVDMRSYSAEPGFEYKENLNSIAQTAAAGGYTHLVCRPDTNPTIESKSAIRYFITKSARLPITILPTGAITKGCEGIEMNELYDMHCEGAVAFANGNISIMHAGVLQRALEYSKVFGGLIISHAHDKNIAAATGINEGETGTYTGMKGIPHMAEELMVMRDIELARYTQARLHVSHISTAGSVILIKKAKKDGLNITCDVAVPNLIWTDTMLESYDTNYKLNPPLRTKFDQKALWDGIADGTIDAIVSDHTPEDSEHKNVEFEYAAHGMIQLQTALSLLYANTPKNMDIDKLVNALSIKPRQILGLQDGVIAQGNIADLCLFDPKLNWQYNQSSNLSLSHNSPLLGNIINGKVLAIIHKNILTENTVA